MADSKISALTAATTPLAGTEVLPIVQGGATVKVAVNDLTAGKSVTAASLVTTGNIGINTTLSPWVAGAKAQQLGSYSSMFESSTGITQLSFNLYESASNTYKLKQTEAASVYIQGSGTHYWKTVAAGTAGDVVTPTMRMTLDATNLTLSTGNLVPQTAAKGINFTANTPAAGMTSQLLNWYEEGAWTPNQGAGLTLVGAFSSNGTYVRIGRSVTVKGQVLGATTVAVAAAGVISTNLPFAAASGHAGSMYNAAITVGGVVAITTSSVTAADAMAATASITFTATYQV